MKFFDRTTYSAPPWTRGTISGSNSQLAPEAGARPLFSNPMDEESYETRFDKRQSEQMSIKEAAPTDKSYGGEDA